MLSVFNTLVVELNGLPVKSDSLLSNTRLEPYALVVLFYKLHKIYPIYTYDLIELLIKENATIQSIIQLYESS